PLGPPGAGGGHRGVAHRHPPGARATPAGATPPRGLRRLAGYARRVAGSDSLASFTPPVREWFERSFSEPTLAQSQAWPAIARGENVLLSAPTGSGKTLAAFLWALDRLVADPEPERTRLVYVSPLKALSYDI